ncbi:hypothetical protein D3C73_1528570 [compost metagenome]
MSDRLATMARFDESMPEPRVVAECCQCGREIYAGEVGARVDGESWAYVHDYCAFDYAIERIFDGMGVINADGTVE